MLPTATLLDCCDLLRSQAGGDGDCHIRRHPNCKKVLTNSLMWSVAAFAFIGISFFKVPFPAIVFSAGLVGAFSAENCGEINSVSQVATGQASATTAQSFDEQDTPEHAKPSWARALRVCIVCGLLWWVPIFLIGVWRWNGMTRCSRKAYSLAKLQW